MTLDELVARLREFGLHVEAAPGDPGRQVDADLTLVRGESRQEFAIELKDRVRGVEAGELRRADERPLLVGTTRVSTRTADAFRRAGVQYIDSAGNAAIRFGDVLIDIRGRPAVRDVSDSTPARYSNLFSTARAQVAFILLQWPTTWNDTQRAIARAAGVSLGQVNDAMTLFRDAGFGPGGHRGDAELLDLWIAAYPLGLGRKLVLGAYRGALADVGHLREEASELADAEVSGEFAAHALVRPASLTLYLPELDPMFPVRQRWRSDGEPNITLKRRFWTPPHGAAEDRSEMVAGLPTAPPVLVYADLLASDDPRVRGAADEWRRSHGMGH